MTAERFAARVLEEKGIAVCVGCGGVGKTTIAAALGLEAARRGHRALVLTIDPARRLADALGVEELGNEPQAIPRAKLDALGVPPEGSLSAVMLDMKRTFDDLVRRLSDSAETRDRVLANPLYQHISEALAGSQEYSAMDKVVELHQREDVDLLVVDTPPSQHALDFLEAPQRLIDFFDSRVVKLLIHPAFSAGRLGFRVFHRGAQRILQALEQITGLAFLEDFSEFLLAFEGIAEGFRERAQEARQLLSGKRAAFVLVAGPGAQSVAQAEQFLERLQEHKVPLAGVLANRMHLWPAGRQAPAPETLAAQATRESLAAALCPDGGSDFPAARAAQAAIDAATRYAGLVERDARAVEPLRKRARARRCHYAEIPELEGDVHDLAGLARLAGWVLQDGA